MTHSIAGLKFRALHRLVPVICLKKLGRLELHIMRIHVARKALHAVVFAIASIPLLSIPIGGIMASSVIFAFLNCKTVDDDRSAEERLCREICLYATVAALAIVIIGGTFSASAVALVAGYVFIAAGCNLFTS